MSDKAFASSPGLDEPRFSPATLAAGVAVTLASCAATGAYVAATWSRSERLALVALTAFAAVVAVVIALLPAERIVRSRHATAFFVAWTCSDGLLIAAVAYFDGGVQSPLALLVFLTVAFTGLYYPLAIVALTGAFQVVTLVAVELMIGGGESARLWSFVFCLAATTLLCASQARGHDRRRAELARLSCEDALTTQLNRRGFEQRFEVELQRAARTEEPLALLILDLDDFKAVNDTFGHTVGDELLRWVAERLEETVRGMDSIGRLGGDEFAVLVPGADGADALATAERCREAVLSRIGISVGFACFPADGRDRAELHRRADANLYEAKGSPRERSRAGAGAS